MRRLIYKYRFSIFLGSIPPLVFAFGLSTRAEKPLPPRQTVSIYEKAITDSFSKRFGEPLPAETRVRTIPIVRELAKVHPPLEEQKTEESPPPPPKKKPRVRYSSRGDICARHGMRKEITRGGRSWRCRR